jgi:hypothetical protein
VSLNGLDQLLRDAERIEMRRKRRFGAPLDRVTSIISAIINPSSPTTIAPGALPPLAGDVTGAPGANTVVKVQGIAVSATDPTTGQVLKFNGTAWAPDTDAGGTPASTVVTETAFGQASAVGVGTLYARNDHTHGTPANPVTAHEAAADPHAGYLLESLLDAKGDLIAASADNTPTKVTVGTNGQVLTANSALAAGVEWTTPAAASGQYRVMTYVLDGMGGFDFVVDGSGNPVTALEDLE